MHRQHFGAGHRPGAASPLYRRPGGGRRSVAARLLAGLAAAFVAVLLAGAACTDVAGPRIPTQDRPFYYYNDQPVYLEVQGSILTVATLDDGEGAIAAVLAAAGVAADSITRMPQATYDPHWMVNLAAGQDAETAARALRLAAGVAFASAGYRLAEGDSELYLLNRFCAEYEEGATDEEIARLKASIGAEDDPSLQSSFMDCMLYPMGADRTPLEIAAWYHDRSIVRYAEPDKVSTGSGPL